MNPPAHYREILALSERMLASARAGRWESLVVEGKSYSEAVLLADAPSSGNDAAQCAEIIASILENDRKIKQLVKSRMDDLNGALSSVNQSIKLNQAYR